MSKNINRKVNRKVNSKDYKNKSKNNKLLSNQNESIEYLSKQTSLYLNNKITIAKDSSSAKCNESVAFNYKNFVDIKNNSRYFWLIFYILVSGYLHWLYLYNLSGFQETYYKITGNFFSDEIKKIYGKVSSVNKSCSYVRTKHGRKTECSYKLIVEVDKKQLKIDNASEELYQNNFIREKILNVSVRKRDIVEIAYLPNSKKWDINYFFISDVNSNEFFRLFLFNLFSPISLLIALGWFLIVHLQAKKQRNYVDTHYPLYVRLAYVDHQIRKKKNKKAYDVYANVYSLVLPNKLLLYFYGDYSTSNVKYVPNNYIFKKLYIFDKKGSSYYIEDIDEKYKQSLNKKNYETAIDYIYGHNGIEVDYYKALKLFIESNYGDYLKYIKSISIYLETEALMKNYISSKNHEKACNSNNSIKSFNLLKNLEGIRLPLNQIALAKFYNNKFFTYYDKVKAKEILLEVYNEEISKKSNSKIAEKALRSFLYNQIVDILMKYVYGNK
ncbi:MAG: hypothetical protein ACI4V7_09890 [Succinivibrionaceae bacterium]